MLEKGKNIPLSSVKKHKEDRDEEQLKTRIKEVPLRPHRTLDKLEGKDYIRVSSSITKNVVTFVGLIIGDAEIPYATKQIKRPVGDLKKVQAQMDILVTRRIQRYAHHNPNHIH